MELSRRGFMLSVLGMAKPRSDVEKLQDAIVDMKESIDTLGIAQIADQVNIQLLFEWSIKVQSILDYYLNDPWVPDYTTPRDTKGEGDTPVSPDTAKGEGDGHVPWNIATLGVSGCESEGCTLGLYV